MLGTTRISLAVPPLRGVNDQGRTAASCFRVDAESLAEPHREQRAFQAVLEGQSDAEVRCKA